MRTWDEMELGLGLPGAFDSTKYEMRREGKKQYGFYYGNPQAGAGAVKRYKCSHPEAQRRFKLWLIVKRLTS